LGVIAINGGRLSDVQGFSLGYAVDYIDHGNDFGQFSFRKALGQGGSDVSGADNGNFVKHGEKSSLFTLTIKTYGACEDRKRGEGIASFYAFTP